MRHRKAGTSLNKDTAHKKAMLINLSKSLIEHEQIVTTLPKAKELKRFVEPIINSAKKDTVASRRLVFNRIRCKKTVGKLFSDLGNRFKERPGGYLSVLKYKYRAGDAALMALVTLTEHTLDKVIAEDTTDSENVIEANKNVGTNTESQEVEAKEKIKDSKDKAE